MPLYTADLTGLTADEISSGSVASKAVAAWPSTINVTNFAEDYSEKYDTNFAEFAPDIGPPKRRRRMSLVSDALQFSMYLTSAEVETFRTFYSTTLKDGTLPFTFPKPRTGVIEQFIFTGSSPTIKFVDYGIFQVSMTWKSIPNTRASWLPLLSSGVIPSIVPTTFSDFTTEGSTDPHYWYLGNRYGSFSSWLAAMGGTFARTGTANYFKSGLMVSAATGIPRFPTDASGVATGFRGSSAATELCLWNRDLTNAAWTKTSCTAAKTQTGIDGVTNSASLLTATAGSASANQALTASSAAYITGFWLKRITGTGTIQISIDNGTTKTTVVPTSTWTFFPIAAAQTLSNPRPWIGITTSTDAIAVDFASVRAGTGVVDPIATTTATVTQNADLLSFPQTSQTFSIFAQLINLVDVGANRRVVSLNDAGDTGIFVNSSPLSYSWWNASGIINGSTLTGFTAKHKVMAGGSASLSTGLLCADGKTPVVITEPFEPNTHTQMYIGDSASGGANGDTQQFALWDSLVATSADLVRLTT